MVCRLLRMLRKNIFLQISERHDNYFVNNWFGIEWPPPFSAMVRLLTMLKTVHLNLLPLILTRGQMVHLWESPVANIPGTRKPAIPYVKNLNATVDGTDLKVNYEAGVGSTNPQP